MGKRFFVTGCGGKAANFLGPNPIVIADIMPFDPEHAVPYRIRPPLTPRVGSQHIYDSVGRGDWASKKGEPKNMLLNIQKKRIGADVVVLGVAGRITLGRDCQEVESQVEDLLKEHEKKIIFDFSELKYLDSTGVGILVMCSGKVKQAGGELCVARAQGVVEQTLKMTSVDQIVSLYPTVEAAAENLASIPRPAIRPSLARESLSI